MVIALRQGRCLTNRRQLLEVVNDDLHAIGLERFFNKFEV
jgi:hypothetical protein